MIPENLIFISAQPHDPYFQWQIEVQITNFRKFNISDRMYIIVWYPKGSNQIDAWRKLQLKYSEVHIFLFEDSGVDLGLYIPQLRPHILAKFFGKYKGFLQDKVFFYHDSDIIFNYLPEFGKLCSDNICWQSDTSSYLDYDYFRSVEKKGNLPEEEAIKEMANIGGVTINKIKSYNKKTGGAQYILKGIDENFWLDVEQQCIEIRKAFAYHIKGSFNNRYFKSESDGFQSWCADMWAVNFSLWKRNIETDITPELDFSWATDSYDTYLKKPIFHNAGATSAQPGIFYKGDWITKSPLFIKHDINGTKASSAYVKAIMDVE